MSSNSWFERNQGFVDFSGHLVAIGQRNALIQQHARTQALAEQGLALEEHRREAEVRQDHRKNILYEINQAATLASTNYAERPEQAYYESLLLLDKVAEIELHHSWFSELDWKDYCSQTITTVSELVAVGESQLGNNQVSAIQRAVFEEHAAVRYRAEEQRNEGTRMASQTEVKHLEEALSKFQLGMVGCGLFVLASLFLMGNNEAGTAWLGLIFFGGGGIIILIRYLDAREQLKKHRHNHHES